MPTFAEQNELSGPQQIPQQPVFGKEIHCIFNRKNIVTVYREIKATATQGNFFHLLFSIRKDPKKITDPLIHYINSSSASAYSTSSSYLDKKVTHALVPHQKVTDVTYTA